MGRGRTIRAKIARSESVMTDERNEEEKEERIDRRHGSRRDKAALGDVKLPSSPTSNWRKQKTKTS